MVQELAPVGALAVREVLARAQDVRVPDGVDGVRGDGVKAGGLEIEEAVVLGEKRRRAPSGLAGGLLELVFDEGELRGEQRSGRLATRRGGGGGR